MNSGPDRCLGITFRGGYELSYNPSSREDFRYAQPYDLLVNVLTSPRLG